jgi:hypothetical protein
VDLGVRGVRLWESLLEQDDNLTDEGNPLREVALSACRTADRVENLEQLAKATDPVVEGRGGPMVHPIFAEVRQQSALLARLVAALRLPDAATGKKPQKRQIRGVQKPSAVSSLDRARQAKTGA